jgi:hypothetical protein
MSLFADNRYQWRETYFVLFEDKHRPTAAAVEKVLAELGSKIELSDSVADDDGLLESLTILAHADSAGMDVIYVDGDEVQEQLAELKREWKGQMLAGGDRSLFDRLAKCNARYDVFHFEELGDSFLDENDDEGALDPATLLLVLGKLARLCHGIAIDPQSGPLV